MDFDFESLPKYVRDAWKDKCWSVATDYLRAKVLYEEGGWYLDTDVEILKPFMDKYSKYDVAVPVEDSLYDWPEERIQKYYLDNVNEKYQRVKSEFISGIALLVSVIGAKKHSQYTKKVMDFFKTLDYDKRDYTGCLFGGPIGPQIWARVLEDYGFVYKGEEQDLKHNIKVMSPKVAKNMVDDSDYKNPELCALHHCTFSWFKQFMEKSGLGDKYRVME